MFLLNNIKNYFEVAEENGYASIRLDILARQEGSEEDYARMFKAAFGSKVAIVLKFLLKDHLICQQGQQRGLTANITIPLRHYSSRGCVFCI